MFLVADDGLVLTVGRARGRHTIVFVVVDDGLVLMVGRARGRQAIVFVVVDDELVLMMSLALVLCDELDDALIRRQEPAPSGSYSQTILT